MFELQKGQNFKEAVHLGFEQPHILKLRYFLVLYAFLLVF
jgi:hypothetical protein